MMARYIDAEALKLLLVPSGKPKSIVEAQVCNVIDSSPTADATHTVYGAWTTMRSEMHDGEYYCSICEYEPYMSCERPAFNYCPKCGAKMLNIKC